MEPGQVAELLRTVIRKWPAGSFLLMRLEGRDVPFQLKPIKGAPNVAAEDVRLVILDGQQRMTSLFQTLTDRSEEVYYIEILKVLETGELDDDHLKYLKKSTWAKEYPTPESMATAGIIPVHMVWNDQMFDDWKAFLPDNISKQMLNLRQQKLPGLRSYDVPAVVLPADVDFAAIAKIFETLNKTGTRLDVFDLMVARLFPQNFRLRDEWDEAKKRYPRLETFNAEGIDVLRLIALREHLSGKTKVKGIRQSDVLNLDPKTVIADWTKAVDGLHRAIEFVDEQLGARSEALVPSWTMLLPLADALWEPGAYRTNWKADLTRWAWITALGNFYAQGANTQAVADAKALRAWFHDATAVPNNTATFEFDPAVLLDLRRRNESVLRALLCMSIMMDARDWILKDQRIRELKDPIEIHHIFPEKYLDSSKEEDADVLVNFAAIRKATNTSLRNDPPSEVLKRTEVSISAVESHRIPVTPMKTNDWKEFKPARQALLAGAISDFLALPVKSNEPS